MADPPRRSLKHVVPEIMQGSWKRRKTDSAQAERTAPNSSMSPSSSSQQSMAVFPGYITNGSSYPPVNPVRIETTSAQPWSEISVAPSFHAASGSAYPSLNIPRVRMTTSPKRTGWVVLKEVLKAVRDGSDLFLPLKAALVGVVEVMDMIDNLGEARDGFEQIAQDIGRLMQNMSAYGSEQHTSLLVLRRLKRIEQELNRIKQKIESKTRRNLMRRVFESWTDVTEVESVFRGLAAMIDDFQLECNLHTERMAEDLDVSRLMTQLQHVPDAGIDAQAGAECMQGTRVALLDDLKDWSLDSAAPRIFWLDGMAGTGKSAIARSLCLILRRAGIFGGSFFCSRGTNRDDIKRIIPTLAVSLAYQFPAYKWALMEVLRKHPDAGHDKVEFQVERLLRSPLREAFGDVLPTLVLVVDALDECADEDATSTILTHLLQVSSWMPIKFFVTSRPEQHIRSRFDMEGAGIRRILRLHEMEDSIVEADIYIYIGHRLREVRQFMAASDPSYPFPPKWPTQTDIATLAHQAGKLFIYAFTATGYIQKTDPVERLRRFTGLKITAGRPMNGPLDDMYTFILDKALDPKQYEAEELCSIRRILAAILTVREHLSLNVLAELIDIPPQRIRIMLQALHTVVYVPPQDHDGVVSTFHASFGDFLTTPERAGQFLIDRQAVHRDLADGCIRIMDSDLLHFNVSGCQTSYLPNEKQKCAALPKQLTYACIHLYDHIAALEDASTQLQCLSTVLFRKFLFWLEVLSTLRQTYEADCLLEELLDADHGHMADAIARSVPHIYLSALPSIGPSSRIAEAFWPEFLNVPVIMTMEASEHCNVLEYNDDAPGALAVAFSPDGTRIASGSDDKTIRIWDASTGQALLEPLEGHKNWVTSVAFSPDGTRIVSGSRDNAIRIWDASTGQALLELLEGHTSWVNSVAFSPDGIRIDGTIRIWDASTGQALLEPLEGHTKWVTSVAFSPDGTRIVSGSGDSTIRIWDASTGQALLEPLEGHTELVTSVAFSPDGTRIVSGSWDKTIRIWDASTSQALLEPLEGHTKWVTSVAFSPDGIRIVSGSQDRTIRIWDVGTARVLPQSLQGHSRIINAVAGSSDGTHIASGSQTKSNHSIACSSSTRPRVAFSPHITHPPLAANPSDSDASNSILPVLEPSRHHFLPGSPSTHDDASSVCIDSSFDPLSLYDGAGIMDPRDIFSFESDNDYDNSGWITGGWITGPRGELVLWIPEKYYTGLWWPRTVLIIGRSRVIDLKAFVHGTDWTKCYTPGGRGRIV
ncbi:hypothetical protein CERSUDRAFT_144952 [Gelatoporia subvermispora B]|uniref:NACHT domain-containing protein n=1 Tax=Ceriporiopsis subvermispora (strain B) TaxID=914234 RepID=M2P804_CERS8|nr:hypothetical protein CERSUDRAFT_144952 [Gelatoporia subvermispora B]